MGDFYTGYCDAGSLRVSDAVAASSAFPPGFSAFRLDLSDGRAFTDVDPWGDRRVLSAQRGWERRGLSNQPVLLTDGGVYDNLAVEPVWTTYSTLFVSDAGTPFESERGNGQALIPRLRRAAEISMEQVAAVRKRWLVDELGTGRRTGAIWTLHSRPEDVPLKDGQSYGTDARKLLHKVRTDLNAFSRGEIACLENHGYSLADMIVRSRAPSLCPNLSARFRWPNEEWCDDGRLTEALKKSHKREVARDVARYFGGRTQR